MSDRDHHDRGAVTALGLILAAIVLTASITTYREPRLEVVSSLESQGAQPQEQQRVAPVEGSSDFLFLGEGVAQWVMAAFTIAATAVSIYAVRLVRDTFRETRRTATAAVETNKTAREIGEAQVRAYLAADGGSFDIKDNCVQYQIRFKNVGQSPAKSIRAKCVVALSVGEHGHWTEFSAAMYGVHTIGAGGAEEAQVLFNDAGNPAMRVSPPLPLPEIPAEAMADLRDERRRHIEVRVTVGWNDVFGRRQNQTFSFVEDSTIGISRDGEGKAVRRQGRFSQGKTSHYQDNVQPKA